jgi:hypothetical protein
MKTKAIILTLIIGHFSIVSYGQVAERIMLEMYCSALENNSTAPNYVVVTVKNLKTGELKEICTEAPFLNGALDHETGKKSEFSCEIYEERYFEFSNDSALWNISFDLYTLAELNNYAKTINVSEIIHNVKSAKLTRKTFTSNWKEQIMFAHLMFNNGVMMTRGCITGNVCSLTYFEPLQ